jgi:hypothetical protein
MNCILEYCLIFIIVKKKKREREDEEEEKSNTRISFFHTLVLTLRAD